MINFSCCCSIIQIVHFDFAIQSEYDLDFLNQKNLNMKLPSLYDFLYFLIFRRMTKIVCFIKIIVYWIFSLIFSSMPITQIFRCIYKTFLNHAC